MLENDFDLPKLKKDDGSKAEIPTNELELPQTVQDTPSESANTPLDIPVTNDSVLNDESSLVTPEIPFPVAAQETFTPEEIQPVINPEAPPLEPVSLDPVSVDQTPQSGTNEPAPEMAPLDDFNDPFANDLVIDVPEPAANLEGALPVADLDTPITDNNPEVVSDSFNEEMLSTPVTETPSTPEPIAAIEENIEDSSIDEWTEKPLKAKSKKDPIVIIASFLIILLIIGAALYFFASQGIIDLPFDIPFISERSNTPNNLVPDNNDSPSGTCAGVEREVAVAATQILGNTEITAEMLRQERVCFDDDPDLNPYIVINTGQIIDQQTREDTIIEEGETFRWDFFVDNE